MDGSLSFPKKNPLKINKIKPRHGWWAPQLEHCGWDMHIESGNCSSNSKCSHSKWDKEELGSLFKPLKLAILHNHPQSSWNFIFRPELNVHMKCIPVQHKDSSAKHHGMSESTCIVWCRDPWCFPLSIAQGSRCCWPPRPNKADQEWDDC